MLEPVDRMPTVPPVPFIGVAQNGVAAAEVLQTSGAGQGGGAGGGYVFTPDEIDSVIKDWQNLLDEIEQDERDARVIAEVDAPGLEFASGEFQNAAGPSGQMLRDQIQRTKKYVGEYITALQDAKNTIVQQEDDTTAHVNNADSGMV